MSKTETVTFERLPLIYKHLGDIIGNKLGMKVWQEMAILGRSRHIRLPYYCSTHSSRRSDITQLRILEEVIGSVAFKKLDDEYWRDEKIVLPPREVLRKLQTSLGDVA